MEATLIGSTGTTYRLSRITQPRSGAPPRPGGWG
jgi:hypothetical protein